MMRRRLAFLFLLVSLSLLFGCSRPDKATETRTAADPGQPVQGDWAVVRFEAEPDSLNPITSVTQAAHYALWGVNNSQVSELLMGYNTKDWTLTEPLLVEAPPTVSEDRLTYTFTIRDGVRWHDGKPFTPEDVLFTFKAAACPLVDSAPVRSYLTDLVDVQLEGRTMRFLMSKPNVYNVGNIANTLAMIPKHVFDTEGLLDGYSYKGIIGPKGKTDPNIKKFANQFNSHPGNRAPIGTGPYKFEKWDTGSQIVLVRNDNYWGKKAYLDKIVYRIIGDYTAALTALKSGEVDFLPRLLPIQYAEQMSGADFDRQFTKVKYSIPAEFHIMWNNEREVFKDKRVRQAMTMLVHRQAIIDKIRFGMGKIGIGPIDPKSPHFNPNIQPWPYDPKRAAELLDEADWKDHDGDGMRDKNGMKFKFEFLASTSSTIFPQLSPIIRDAMRRVGIEMTERLIDFSVMTSSLADHKFDATVLGASYDLVQDQYQLWHSTQASNRGSNFVSFKNPESDRLLEQARLEFDAEKRKQLYWRWQEIIHEEQPWTFLYYQEEPAAYSKRFLNVAWLPLRPGYDLNSWWVPQALQKYKNTTSP